MTEALHRAIIDDSNGEQRLDASSSNEGTHSHLAEVESDDQAELEEAKDEVVPLPSMSPCILSQQLPVSNLTPGHVVLLLDTSGSMRIVDTSSSEAKGAVIARLEAAALCAQSFVELHAKSRSQDFFSLVVFEEEAEVLAEAVDAAAAQEALQQLPVRGANGTSYRAALGAATRLLALFPTVCRHVVMLSDGRPADTKKALEYFQDAYLKGPHTGTRVHGIGFGDSVQSFAPLQQLSCLSGGTFALSGHSVKGLLQAFSSVSSTITSASSGSIRNEVCDQEIMRRPRRPAQFELPELGVFGKKNTLRIRASRVTFRYDGSQFHEERWPANEVVRRTRPYMRGGMRLVYGFQDKVAVPEEGSWMVAKSSRFLEEATSSCVVVHTHVKSTAVARHLAARFNERLRALRGKIGTSPFVFFVPCFAYEVEESSATFPEGDIKAFAGERYLPGAFLKYNSNNGYVAESFLQHHGSVQAFLHFTFEATGGSLLVADLQGVARQTEVLLTDPQVLSMEQAFGPGDLGCKGIRACLASHRCGPMCRALNLKPVSASLLHKLDAEAGKSSRIRRQKTSSSASSAGWLKLSSSSVASDWEKVNDKGVEQYAMSEGVQSSHNSTSSWALLDI